MKMDKNVKTWLIILTVAVIILGFGVWRNTSRLDRASDSYEAVVRQLKSKAQLLEDDVRKISQAAEQGLINLQGELGDRLSQLHARIVSAGQALRQAELGLSGKIGAAAQAAKSRVQGVISGVRSELQSIESEMKAKYQEVCSRGADDPNVIQKGPSFCPGWTIEGGFD